MIRKILNKETLLYLFFGVATTVVNYVVFTIFYNILFRNARSLLANFAAFVAAVVFAFVVNKVYVFGSKKWDLESLKREIPPFLLARLGSFGIEEAGLFFSETVLRLNRYTLFEIAGHRIDGIVVAKIVLSGIVVVMNYVFCKWFVFKKKS